MSKSKLYVVTGVSGRTGGATAKALLQKGERVRVIVRDKTKGKIWAELGAEVAIADFSNTDTLCNAFSDADGAYIVSPPQYHLDNLFEQADNMARSIADAASKAQLAKLVVLSSIGAEQSTGTGWIAMNSSLERHLNRTGLAVAYLRAPYFMENWQQLVKVASAQHELPSFLAPLDHKFSMIATEDIGFIAAQVLTEQWHESRTIALEGPDRYSPIDVANALTQTLGQTIKPVAIPESQWLTSISGQGFSAAAKAGFVEMTKGLNSGHISFEHLDTECKQGKISLETVINTLVM